MVLTYRASNVPGKVPSKVPQLPHRDHNDNHEHSTRIARYATAAVMILAVLSGIVWMVGSVRSQSLQNQRNIVALRDGISSGMTRDEAYAWLRAHDLVATNSAFAIWRKNSMGVWYRSSDGAWPEPDSARSSLSTVQLLDAAHPEIEVKLFAGGFNGCGTTVVELIEFDRFERVKAVAASTPYYACE